MILYFSATGNSEYAAKRMGKELCDTVVNLFERIRSRDFSSLYSEQPWVIVSPTYAWRIPRILREWISRTSLEGSENVYFVLTCGDSIGNAGLYLKKQCSAKGLHYLGCAGIVMPENYLALFSSPGREKALEIIKQAEAPLDQAISRIRQGQPFPHPAVTLKDKISSGIVNDLFYPTTVHARKFFSTRACISCNTCAEVCPLNNIRLEHGRPLWGRQCTHCMACICRCPTEAIEYGKRTKGMTRYTCPVKL